jgi:hypothetical protein
MGIYNPPTLPSFNLENIQTLEKLGESNGRLTFNGVIVAGGTGSNGGGIVQSILEFNVLSINGFSWIFQSLLLPNSLIYKVEVDFPVRIRLYADEDKRIKDLSRPTYVSPIGGYNDHGLLLDVALGVNFKPLSINLSPCPLIYKLGETVPCTIENLSAMPQAIKVTLNVFELVS